MVKLGQVGLNGTKLDQTGSTGPNGAKQSRTGQTGPNRAVPVLDPKAIYMNQHEWENNDVSSNKNAVCITSQASVQSNNGLKVP